MMDVVTSAVEVTGPASLELGTWTISIDDVRTIAWMLENGDLTRVKVLVDRSFRSFRSYYSALIELLGRDSVIETRTHAKFAILRNNAWNVAIRSSMNANKNTRWEQVDVDDDAGICDLFSAHIDALTGKRSA